MPPARKRVRSETDEIRETFEAALVGGFMRPAAAGRLYKYQRDAVRSEMGKRMMRREPGVFLAFDMGLGKTVICLASLCLARNTSLAFGSWKPAAIVCPKALIEDTWLAHIREWTSLTAEVVTLSTVSGGRELPPADVYIMTYQAMAGMFKRACGGEREVEFYETASGEMKERRYWRKKLRCPVLDMPKSAVVFDEAHEMRNGKTITNHAGREMAGDFRIMSTGTPVNNRPSDLYALSIVAGIDVDESDWKNSDRTINKRFALSFIGKHICRMTKADLDPPLPPCHDVLREYSLDDPGERRLYNRLLADAQEAAKEVRKNDIESIRRLGEAIGKLKRGMFHGSLLRSADDPCVRAAGAAASPSSKMRAISALVDEIAGRHDKFIIIGHETVPLESLKRMMDADPSKGFESVVYCGKLSDGGRRRALRRFRDDASVRVMFLSMHAGGVGLNLAPHGTAVVFADLWYNKQKHLQARDRIHRVGQELPVYSYTMYAAKSVEEGILRMHEDKARASDAMVDGEFGWMPDQDEAVWKKQASLVQSLEPME